MKYPEKVHEGVFLKRYKRFFADVKLGSQVVVAHVPNTGSLKTATTPGARCLLTESSNPERKLKFTLEAVEVRPGCWAGVNTSWPNKLAKEAFEQKIFSHWSQYDTLQGEVKINKETRLDLALSRANSEKKHFVEIKNVTMAVGETGANQGCAQFPDAVTERGQKHLRELMALIDEGHTAELLFTVQRSDCQTFSPADEIDKTYGALLREAHKKGVVVTVAEIQISEREIRMTNKFLELKFPKA